MRKKYLEFSGVKIVPVWSDSMGAKSFSIYVDTGDIRILIDPSASVMHPSFPLDERAKGQLVDKAITLLSKYAKKADVITITHYHYDHYKPSLLEFYLGKILLVKNPNQYINESQRKRAEEFFSLLYKHLTQKEIKLYKRQEKVGIPDFSEKLKKALSRDYGDYNERKKELIRKGLSWISRLSEKWNNWEIIPELDIKGTRWIFADGREFKFGGTIIKFQEPMFHGIEFSRVGWVIPIVIKTHGVKILYSSDLNGPIIEDYADWIIRENPDILFLDGPATYMIPYTLNLINFRRAIENLITIIDNVDSQIIFLDHHVTRDPKFRKRIKKVYEEANETGKKILAFSEFYGKKPLAETLG